YENERNLKFIDAFDVKPIGGDSPKRLRQLKDYFEDVGITHQTSIDYTPQQNEVVERRNCTLVEDARMLLIFLKSCLFLWDDVVATACFTHIHSIIHTRYNKTPYDLINDKKPNILYIYVFGALCYPYNEREDRWKLKGKGDIGFFIGYCEFGRGFRIYNIATEKVMETVNVKFDELSAMVSE
ncbi:retrovirus-related pol polyprotein from transposon TNT 1-94, partial [Tanacetum coccineum]